MIERLKTYALVLLVVASLVQSYFLAYSIPSLGAKVATEQDYVVAEKMGAQEKVDNLVFPEDIVVHLGEGVHTLFYPGNTFYEEIYKRIRGREFKGFQRNPVHVLDWEEVRNLDAGVELRFGEGVPVALLQKVLKLEGDPGFLADEINRIWIFKKLDREEVHTYFFSSDGLAVYESVRADLTVRDVQDYVGFGAYWIPYMLLENKLYLPMEPIESMQATVGYDMYTPEQMQRNLFSDSSNTRALEGRNGSQIYTDGKRGLQFERDGSWMSYTDPVAPTDSLNILSENVAAAVEFVNQHGGWDGLYRFNHPGQQSSGRTITFQRYYGSFPIIARAPLQFGQFRLQLQQGVVMGYERSLITLGKEESRQERWLPGGDQLVEALKAYERYREVVAVYPALEAERTEDSEMQLMPVWAVRLLDGTQHVLAAALPLGAEVEPRWLDNGKLPSMSSGAGEDGEAGDGEEPDVPAGTAEDGEAESASAGVGSIAAAVGAVPGLWAGERTGDGVVASLGGGAAAAAVADGAGPAGAGTGPGAASDGRDGRDGSTAAGDANGGQAAVGGPAGSGTGVGAGAGTDAVGAQAGAAGTDSGTGEELAMADAGAENPGGIEPSGAGADTGGGAGAGAVAGSGAGTGAGTGASPISEVDR